MKKKLGKNRYQPLAERDGARGVATPGVGVCVCGFNWEDHWDDGHRKSTNPVSPDFNWTLPPPSSSLDVFDFYSFFLWIMHRRLRRDRLLPSFFCFCFFVVFCCFAFYWSGFTEFYFQFFVVVFFFFGFHYRVSLEDDVPIERFRRKKKEKGTKRSSFVLRPRCQNPIQSTETPGNPRFLIATTASTPFRRHLHSFRVATALPFLFFLLL